MLEACGLGVDGPQHCWFFGSRKDGSILSKCGSPQCHLLTATTAAVSSILSVVFCFRGASLDFPILNKHALLCYFFQFWIGMYIVHHYLAVLTCPGDRQKHSSLQSRRSVNISHHELITKYPALNHSLTRMQFNWIRNITTVQWIEPYTLCWSVSLQLYSRDTLQFISGGGANAYEMSKILVLTDPGNGELVESNNNHRMKP